jgi:hypothetical protein
VPATNAVYTLNRRRAQPRAFSRETSTTTPATPATTRFTAARFDTPLRVPFADDFDAERQYCRHGSIQDSLRQRAAERSRHPVMARHGLIGRASPTAFTAATTLCRFSDILYPQDHRNCTTCHEETDADTPEASNYRITVNSAPCGACHDATTQRIVAGVPQGSAPAPINFQTGQGHGPANLAVQDDCYLPRTDATPITVAAHGQCTRSPRRSPPEVQVLGRARSTLLQARTPRSRSR